MNLVPSPQLPSVLTARGADEVEEAAGVVLVLERESDGTVRAVVVERTYESWQLEAE